jgi:hypothetical protein
MKTLRFKVTRIQHFEVPLKDFDLSGYMGDPEDCDEILQVLNDDHDICNNLAYLTDSELEMEIDE